MNTEISKIVGKMVKVVDLFGEFPTEVRTVILQSHHLYSGVAKSVRQRILIPSCVGSSPITAARILPVGEAMTNIITSP